MKATEIMIGDYICVRDSNGTHVLQVYYIDSISDYIRGKYIDDNSDTGLFHSSIAYPIPLTEEMFERSGWLHNRKWNSENDGRTFAFNFSEWKVSYGDTNVRIIFWKNRSKSLRIVKPGADFIEIPVEFVHELQHALRLCSLSKLADNFKLE